MDNLAAARSDKVTFRFLYAVCIIEGADVALLPATFRALEVSLGLTPQHLASLGLAQALTSSISAPIWGSLADNGWKRKWLLASGALAWGCITIQLAVVQEFMPMLFLRALNGIALATLVPISQSIIADLTVTSERGYAYGLVQTMTSFGVIIGLIYAASISNMVIHGIEGWRIAFGTVGLASLCLAALISAFMSEPWRQRAEGPPQEVDFWRECDKLRMYWRIDTFKVIVLQGLFGSIPWSALAFTTMYFQYVGMTDLRASLCNSAMMVGSALGGVLGGWIGDTLTKWSRFHGRPLTAQISVLAGIPLIGAIFAGVPRRPDLFYVFISLMFFFGLTASWCAVGVNRPILTEVVRSTGRASILAWVIALDGAIAAVCGAPVVALLSERFFGYHPNRDKASAMLESERHANAEALAKAIICCTFGPWVICFMFYTLLHWTYKSDCLEADDVTPDRTPTKSLTETPASSVA